MQWNEIPTSLVNRFRMNTKVSEGGKFLAGEGASLLAIPNGNDPSHKISKCPLRRFAEGILG